MPSRQSGEWRFNYTTACRNAATRRRAQAGGQEHHSTRRSPKALVGNLSVPPPPPENAREPVQLAVPAATLKDFFPPERAV